MTTNNSVVRALILVAGLAGPVSGQSGPPPAQVLDIAPGAASSNPRSMVVMGGVAYFAATNPEHGTELWRSDGTASGTYMVVDIRPGPASSGPGDIGAGPHSAQAKLVVMDDHLYFVADDGISGQELWRSDGTAAGTELVVDAVPGSVGSRPHHLTAVGSRLFFAACEPSTGCELWKSDGTAAGTGLVTEIRVGTQSSYPEYLTALGDVVLFAANDHVLGEELWRSDGTASGTFLVKDIETTPLVYPPDGFGRSYPEWLTRVGDVVLFIARDATHGYELWRTDGTGAGTSMVVDLNPGPDNGVWSGSPSTVQLVDGRLFFLGRTGSGSSYRGMVSDGTTEGTRPTGSWAGADRARLGSFYYFIGFSADGAELWRADTEAGGGSQFANLAPGSSSSNPKFFETIGDRIFFTANGGAGLGEELWQTDGTVPGTLRMSDINPGSGSSSPSKVIRLGDQLLFTASDGATGVELWSISLNRTPIARAGADVELFEDGTASLDASASTDPDGDPMTYEWRDDEDVVLGTEETLSLEGLANGVHQITLVVSDGTLSSTDTVQITLGNTRPLTIRVISVENGVGTLTVSSPASTCVGVAGSDTVCVVDAPFTATVTLTAEASGLSTFIGWNGGACGYGNAPVCNVPMTSAKSVAPLFRGPMNVTINVVSAENGVGTVSGTYGTTPYSCPGVAGATVSCSFEAKEGSILTTTALPNSMSVLDSLTGCFWDMQHQYDPPCSPFPIYNPLTVTATFRRVVPTPVFEVRVVSLENGGGDVMGSVYDASTGLDTPFLCAAVVGSTASCVVPANLGNTVSLYAMPLGMSVLHALAGCTVDPFSANGAGCYPPFTLTDDKTILATFRGPQTLTIEAVSFENGVGQAFANSDQGTNLFCEGVAGTTVTCSAQVRVGDTVYVSAFPGNLSVLDSIAGCTADPFDPNGAGCYPGFVMTGPKAVTATFRGPQTLTIDAASFENGVGQAFVNSDQGTNLFCEGVAGTTVTCSAQVRVGDTVYVSAFPGNLSVLDSIAGCTADPFDPNGAGCYPGFVMTGPKAVAATFRGPQTLTIDAASFENGVGQAFVNSDQGTNLFCEGVAGTTVTCSAQVRVGDTVYVSAFPGNLSVLDSIAGCTADPFDPNGAGCYPGFVMTGPKAVAATFRGPQALGISFSGDGVGAVVVTSVGTCGSAQASCAFPLRIGTVQQIEAMPSADSLFVSWGGVCAGQGPVCSITVSEDANAQANFVLRNNPPVANAGGPYAGVRNQAIAFSGAASSDPDSDMLTYSWDFGDGSPAGSGVAPTHAYATMGTFTVTLTVNDGTMNSTAATVLVTISNQPPTANAGGPYAGVRNQAITFSGAASNDPDGDTLAYTWDFGDGLPAGSGAAPTHAYATAGAFTVTLTVNDGTATSTAATATVTISNQAPTANAGGPYAGVRNQAITFTGAGSNDADSDSLTYSWGFGDGSPAGSGVAPTHAYATAGAFTVTLTVNDGTVNSTTVTATVTISNQAPTANAGGPYSGVRNQAIIFSGAASNDPDADTLTYSWDFGDGSPAGAGIAPTHAYATTGTFTVTLTVNDGTVNSTAATATVTISNQAPTANAGGPYSGVRNQAITFSGAGSSDPDGDTLTYSWDFGDGSPAGSGVAPTHAYATTGAFTVTLTVNDGTVNSTAATATVTISNQAPTANAGGPYAGTRLAAIGFTGAASTDPDGDTLTYSWNFGDGGVATSPTPTHLYTATGAFTVTLTVNDGTTNSAPATSSVTITNVAPTVALTSPGSGAIFHAPAAVVVSANAADADGGVSKVEFYAGAVKIGEALGAPYQILWSATVPGAYTLTAVVTDSSGATVGSVPVNVLINAPPTVALTSPADNAQFASPASITLTAAAADGDGTIAQVQFFRGTTSLGIDSAAPYTVTWTGATVGSYQLTAVATDNRGAIVTSAPITVKVTATLALTADSYVRASSSNSHFGTATELTVQQGSSNSNIRWTHVKFDLTTIPTITNAKVRLFGRVSATTATAINTAAYAVTDTSWTETGIKWSNKPATGTSALTTVAIVNNSTTARWYEFDVTAHLQAEKAAGRNVVTLAFKNLANSTPYVTFTSRQGTAANRPQVVVLP